MAYGAGTPRFALTLSNGQPVLVETGGPGGSARPALAGAALAEAAEQAGGRIAGWVTGLVRSGELSEFVRLGVTLHCPPCYAAASPSPAAGGWRTEILKKAMLPYCNIRSCYAHWGPGALQSAAAVHLPGAATTRFPRAPLDDVRNAPPQSPSSRRLLGPSTHAQRGARTEPIIPFESPLMGGGATSSLAYIHTAPRS